jgi:hypothetical protein
MTTKELQKHIGRKVKSLPRKFRKAISRSLSVDPYLRPDNGNKFREEFERGVKRHEDGNSLVGAVKMALKVGIPALFLGSCIYSTSIHEPQELTLSSIRPRLAEMLYEDENRETTSNIIFDKESTENLPGAYLRGFGFESIPSLAKSVTDNRIVAYLTATHVQAGMGLGTMKASVFTDVQQRIYSAYRHNGNLSRASAANVTYGIISKSIEASLGLASTEGNHVDLEDAMAIARNGIVVVNQAKRASKSQDWKEYQNAKDSNGKHIIDKKERRFVNQWLAQYHLGTS